VPSTRSTQAERRARSRSALLESAARGLSRHGYGNLVLEQVAREAGYTRGALYHQFEDKEALALAVLEWVDQTWRDEVGGLVEQQAEPVAALIALARGHAVFCRRDVARVAIALRLEFSGRDHPVGREVERISETLVKRCIRLIDAGRKDGSIPAGPPARAVAVALVGALEGAVIALAGQAPHDELLAARAVAGVLGLEAHDVAAGLPGLEAHDELRSDRAVADARGLRRHDDLLASGAVADARGVHPLASPPSRRAEARAERILARVRAIPAGFVRTYGDIDPRAPRLVGRVLAHYDPAADAHGELPWHRVVRADGSLAQGDAQRQRLRREGVPMRGDRVDLRRARMSGDPQ